MICEKCKNNEAKVHLIKLINGEKTETWLCEGCAKEITEITFLSSLTPIHGASFQNILNGYFEVLNNNNKEKIEIVCKSCGLKYSEFRKTGILGCGICYDSFTDFLKPMIKRLHGDLEHVGKIPTKAGNEFIEIKRVKRLKEELKKCIIDEKYEKAAILRDEIKMRENSKEVREKDEELDR